MIEVSWSEAIRRRFPETVVLVVSCDRNGRPNVMPAGWSMVTSGKPPMLAVSIGLGRHTHKLIEETGEFVLAFPNKEMKDLVEYTGTSSGRDIQKFPAFNIETAEPKLVRPPLIRNAVACFECRVRGRLVTGDHTIFAGEVLVSHTPEEYRHRLYNFGRRESGERDLRAILLDKSIDRSGEATTLSIQSRSDGHNFYEEDDPSDQP